MTIRTDIKKAWESVCNANDLHPGLCFFTFFHGNIEDADAKEKHLKRMKGLRLLTTGHLLQRRAREIESLRRTGYEAISWGQELITRMAAGLGIESPIDNGITLDRTHGVPLLAGSALKGLAQDRYLEENCTDISDPKPRWETKNSHEFIALFGLQTPLKDEKSLDLKWQEKAYRGNVIFMDALVETSGLVFDVDMVNPHYGPYYTGTSQPADYLKPNPNAFLCVSKGRTFRFAVAGRKGEISLQLTPEPTIENKEPKPQVFKHDGSILVKRASKLVQDALQNLGAGGKTRVGYGYFGKPDDVCAGGASPA